LLFCCELKSNKFVLQVHRVLLMTVNYLTVLYVYSILAIWTGEKNTALRNGASYPFNLYLYTVKQKRVRENIRGTSYCAILSIPDFKSLSFLLAQENTCKHCIYQFLQHRKLFKSTTIVDLINSNLIFQLKYS